MAPTRMCNAQAEVAAVTAQEALPARLKAHEDCGINSRVVCDGVDTNVVILDAPLRCATSFRTGTSSSSSSNTSSSSSSAVGRVGSAAIKVHTGRAGAQGMADSERQGMTTLKSAKMCVPPLAMVTGLYGHASQVYIYPNAGRNLRELSEVLAPQLAAGGERAQAGYDFILTIGFTALTGLCEMHSMGLAHNDVKCDNIFVSDRGVARIGDLGLASWFDGDELPGTDPMHPAVALQTRLPWDTRRRVKDDAHAMAHYNDGRGDVLAVGVALWETVTNGVLPDALAFGKRYSVLEPLVPLFLGRSPSYVQRAVDEAFIDRWCTFVASGAMPGLLQRTVPHAGLRELLADMICAPDAIPSAAALLKHSSFDGQREKTQKFLEAEESRWQADCNAALIVGHRALQAEASVACAMAAAAANLALADSVIGSTNSSSSNSSSSNSSSAADNERGGSSGNTSSASLGSAPAAPSSPVANEAAAGGKGGGQAVQLPRRSNIGSRSSPASCSASGSTGGGSMQTARIAPAAMRALCVMPPVTASTGNSSTDSLRTGASDAGAAGSGSEGASQAVMSALRPAHRRQPLASRSSPSRRHCHRGMRRATALTAPAALASRALAPVAVSRDSSSVSSNHAGAGSLAASGSGAAAEGSSSSRALAGNQAVQASADAAAAGATADSGSDATSSRSYAAGAGATTACAAAAQPAEGAAPKLQEIPAAVAAGDDSSSRVDRALAGDQAAQTPSTGSAPAGPITATNGSVNSLSSGGGEQGGAGGATRYVPGSLPLESANVLPSHRLHIDDEGNESNSWGSTAAAAAATAACVLVPVACGASPAATLLAAALIALA